METEGVYLRLPVSDVAALRRAAAGFNVSLQVLIRVILAQKLREARETEGMIRFETGVLEASIE